MLAIFPGLMLGLVIDVSDVDKCSSFITLRLSMDWAYDSSALSLIASIRINYLPLVSLFCCSVVRLFFVTVLGETSSNEI